MKLPPALLLFLSPLLLISAAPIAVQDLAGHDLLPGTKYHILPLIRGRGGGLFLSPRHNGSTLECPPYVVQSTSELDAGFPLTFSPVDPKASSVPLSTDLNIAFAAATICVQSTVWRLGGVDAGTGRRYVTIGGVKGNPGLETVSSWFRIERMGRGYYKLAFCPGVCKYCKVVCGDLGVFSEGGKRWLGLSDVPFPVTFNRSESFV